MEQKKGLHNTSKPAPVHNIIDLSERFGGKEEQNERTDNMKRSLAAKARGHLSSLRKEQHSGVVEYVFTGSRLKVYVPKENIIISLALAGIRAPGPKTKDGKSDPMGELSLQYTRRNVLQQNVLIEVEDIDKGDNFIGTVFFNNAVSHHFSSALSYRLLVLMVVVFYDILLLEFVCSFITRGFGECVRILCRSRGIPIS
jgi:hypothetical protein